MGSAILTLAQCDLITSVYVGVTESPAWRWHSCHGHNAPDRSDGYPEYEGMVAHEHKFDRMFVLLVDYGEPTCHMEEWAIEILQGSEFGSKSANSEIYHRGPVRDDGKYFLYACVTEAKL